MLTRRQRQSPLSRCPRRLHAAQLQSVLSSLRTLFTSVSSLEMATPRATKSTASSLHSSHSFRSRPDPTERATAVGLVQTSLEKRNDPTKPATVSAVRVPFDRIICAPPTAGLFHATRVSLERNVVKNTLADTPSGYIQDPRAGPRTMPRYDSLSRVGAAAMEAMEQEKDLLEREEFAYQGYTTLRIQRLKRIVMNPDSSLDSLRDAVEGLQADLQDLENVVGQEVEKPISQEHILLLKWQQRQQRLHDRDLAFRVAPASGPGYRLVQQADGTEVMERLGKDVPQPKLTELDDAYLTQPVEMEELPAEALVPERVVVTVADANHVRYLIALALRRLSRFEEAEAVLYTILRDDVTHVDAVESMLEMHLGVDGWEPRVRVLLDFLVDEYDKAIAEGRLQPPSANAEQDSNNSHNEEENVGEGEDSASTVPATPNGATSSSATAASTAGSQSSLQGTHNTTTTTATTSTFSSSSSSSQLAPTTTLTRVRRSTPYATVPQAAPLEVALALLSDIIVEAAAHKCSADGEGATSRFFIESLGPLVRALGSGYAPALLEALFQAVDEQHFMARFDSEDVSPAARMFALSLVIAFLKALTARRIHEMLPDPVRFEFFTLSKLHAALRQAGRVRESYRICEKVMQLYRDNSTVHKRRLRQNQEAALLKASDAAPAPALAESTAASHATADAFTSRAEPSRNATFHSSVLMQGAVADAVSAPHEEDGSVKNVEARGSDGADAADEEAPGILDDQDADYREAFFQYVNDRARDSPVVGRRLCLEAMQEFPRSAAPWETLALLLHKENPQKNLGDAIIAARHAMLLEPLNLNVIVTLANFYKAAHRYELHDRMLDRYRLLVYMSEEGASVEDMMATAAEVEALDRETPEAQDLVAETGQEMSEYLFRMEQATTYSMPIDKEPRHFTEAPMRVFSQQHGMRPSEAQAHETDEEGGMTMEASFPMSRK